MEADLSPLPVLLAKPDDVVLVKKETTDEYIYRLQKTTFKLPRFLVLEDAMKNNSFINSPKNKLMPWGWSPAAHRLLESLKPSCSEAFRNSPISSWKPEYRQIYSKKFAREILQSVAKKIPSDILLPPHLMTEICTTKQDFEELLKKWGKLMVKAPWSSSGRGLQPVTKTPVHPKVWEKLLGVVKEQGYAIAEPFLHKILDMAYQFEIEKGKVRFIGTSFFSTDKKGQYQKSYINGLPADTDASLLQFVDDAQKLVVPVLKQELENSLLSQFYEGFFGVDTLVYLDDNQNFRINPCLEINVRQNMGLLSLKLPQLLPAGKKAAFSTFYQPQTSFRTFAEEMMKKHPPQFTGKVIGSGFFPLTPITEDAAFGAFLQV